LTTQRFNKIPSAEGQPSLKISSIDPEAISALENYEWPGNVRELVNVVERACSMAESHIIRPIDLPPHISGVDSLLAPLAPPMHELPPPSTEKPKRWTELPRRADLQEKPFKEAKEEWVSTFERDYITELLMRHGGNISQASREADIDRKYFKKLMLKYDIEADDF
jgi:DNA-binding NtrC family response regulator